jgi:hypothetical protein
MLVDRASDHAHSMLAAGAPKREILTRLATAGEILAGPGTAVSILVIDEHGLLRNGASPNLPADYLDAIDRLRPDASVGTCAAAAATGFAIETPDFRADDKWLRRRVEHADQGAGRRGARHVRHVLPRAPHADAGRAARRRAARRDGGDSPRRPLNLKRSAPNHGSPR